MSPTPRGDGRRSASPYRRYPAFGLKGRRRPAAPHRRETLKLGSNLLPAGRILLQAMRSSFSASPIHPALEELRRIPLRDQRPAETAQNPHPRRKEAKFLRDPPITKLLLHNTTFVGTSARDRQRKNVTKTRSHTYLRIGVEHGGQRV